MRAPTPRFRILVLAAFGVFTHACSAARPLQPLHTGDFALDVSVPSIWTKGEAFALPVGVIMFGGRYGLLDNTELRLALNPLPLTQGIVAVDIGAIRHLRHATGWIPALHASFETNVLAKLSRLGDGPRASMRGAFDLSLTAHWEPYEWLWPYVLTENAIIAVNGRYVGSLMVGAQMWLNSAWSLSLETGWAGWNVNNEEFSQPYVGPGGYGGIWTAWALTFHSGTTGAPR